MFWKFGGQYCPVSKVTELVEVDAEPIQSVKKDKVVSAHAMKEYKQVEKR